MGTDYVQLFDLSLWERQLASNAESRDVLACFIGSPLYLDYWGCYSEVFGGMEPVGSVFNTSFIPGEEEAWFLFLLPEHIDRMLASLWKHSSELRVPVDIAELRRFREIAAADQNLKVAYVFDY